MAWRIGVDIGGTFTDAAIVDDMTGAIGIAKTLTTPGDFGQGVVNALKELTLSLTLQPFGYSSLAMSAYHYAKVDAYQQGAVYALCLIMVALYPVLSLHRWFDGR